MNKYINELTSIGCQFGMIKLWLQRNSYLKNVFKNGRRHDIAIIQSYHPALVPPQLIIVVGFFFGFFAIFGQHTAANMVIEQGA